MNNIKNLLKHQKPINKLSVAVIKQPPQVLVDQNISFVQQQQNKTMLKSMLYNNNSSDFDIPEFTGEQRKQFRKQQEFVAKAVWVENKVRIENGLVKMMIDNVDELDDYVETQIFAGVDRISHFQGTLRKLAVEVQKKLLKKASQKGKKIVDVQSLLKQMDTGIYIQYQIPVPKKHVYADYL